MVTNAVERVRSNQVTGGMGGTLEGTALTDPPPPGRRACRGPGGAVLWVPWPKADTNCEGGERGGGKGGGREEGSWQVLHTHLPVFGQLCRLRVSPTGGQEAVGGSFTPLQLPHLEQDTLRPGAGEGASGRSPV